MVIMYFLHKETQLQKGNNYFLLFITSFAYYIYYKSALNSMKYATKFIQTILFIKI